MSLYEKMRTASQNKDVAGFLDLLHDDYVFVRHQAGVEMTKTEWAPILTTMMESPDLEIMDERCIYENNEILVVHQFMRFPDNTKEAVLIAYSVLDGKIIRAETGATPIA